MNAVIDFLNLIFWNYVLIYGLLAVGVYFTLRLGFLQFRHFPELFRCVIGSGEVDKNGRSIDGHGVLTFGLCVTSIDERKSSREIVSLV